MNALLSLRTRAPRMTFFFGSLCALFLLLSAAPAFGQVSGAYKGGGKYFVFSQDGTLLVCDLNGNNAMNGSYELESGVISFYEENGKLAGSYYYRKSQGAITLSNDSDSLRLTYQCSVEDFVGVVLVGTALEELFGN